jgi:glycosyltransferase involved in cell wall biosynthesis
MKLELSKKRKKTFASNKALPHCTFVIVTRNNEAELKNILHHLSTHSLFSSDFGNVIIVDFYSFDKTVEIAKQFQMEFPEKIRLIQKNPQKTFVELIHPYASDQMVEFINLMEISRHNHLPPNQYKNWVSKLVKKAGYNSGNVVDNLKIIERMESEREYLFFTIKKSVIEPLTHIEMKLKDNVDGNEDVTGVEVVSKVLSDLQTLIKLFDPSLFIGNTLFPNLTALIEDFSKRSDVTVLLSETGKELKVNNTVGISIIRMVQETLELFERERNATEIDIRIRWGLKKVYVQIKDNSNKVFNRKNSQKSLRFIEERLQLLDGSLRLNVLQDQGVRFLLAIPIEEPDESEEVQ